MIEYIVNFGVLAIGRLLAEIIPVDLIRIMPAKGKYP